METVPDILNELGGVTAISNETGIPLTTVHSWKRTGFVPPWRVPTLVLLAQRLGKSITEASFPQRKPPVPVDEEPTPIPVCELCDEPLPDGAVPVCPEADCPVPAKKAA